MGDDKVLVVKSNRDRMVFKIRQRVHKGYAPDDYNKVLNPRDSNDLALLFDDLDMIANAPIEKAFRKFKDKKEKGFPFF